MKNANMIHHFGESGSLKEIIKKVTFSFSLVNPLFYANALYWYIQMKLYIFASYVLHVKLIHLRWSCPFKINIIYL
jgi:hypothetical protein